MKVKRGQDDMEVLNKKVGSQYSTYSWKKYALILRRIATYREHFSTWDADAANAISCGLLWMDEHTTSYRTLFHIMYEAPGKNRYPVANVRQALLDAADALEAVCE